MHDYVNEAVPARGREREREASVAQRWQDTLHRVRGAQMFANANVSSSYEVNLTSVISFFELKSSFGLVVSSRMGRVSRVATEAANVRAEN